MTKEAKKYLKTVSTFIGIAAFLLGGAFFLDDRYAGHADTRMRQVALESDVEEFKSDISLKLTKLHDNIEALSTQVQYSNGRLDSIARWMEIPTIRTIRRAPNRSGN